MILRCLLRTVVTSRSCATTTTVKSRPSCLYYHQQTRHSHFSRTRPLCASTVAGPCRPTVASRQFTNSIFPPVANRTMCTTSNAVSEIFERLPVTAKPSNYQLTLTPDLEKFTFTGEEIITLDIVKPTKFLKLYSTDINILHAELKTKSNVFTSLPVSYQKRWETAVIDLPSEVPAEEGAQLIIKFEGSLNDKLKGFYRSKYKTASGEEAYMATTQFESTAARRAFPCFDEPIYKSTFDITLRVPKSKTALSNMPIIKTDENADGTKSVHYATTPVMSTYLVAFIVGDFEYIEGKTEDGVVVRVYATPGKKSQGEFALDVAIKAIPFFNKFFKIPYSLPKCDLIAIPDFQFGAMENWGLVTYREVRLLMDPKVSSAMAKEDIALTVAHELAHMWFGNLVTMEWWTDLWLKEGYATWMEYYMVNSAFPEFDIWTQFVNFETFRAMSLDGLKSSHPIEVPINDPEEVDEIYDHVSYAKSASVIRMLHDYLGDETFRKGLQNYLATYKYRNAKTQDLWDCLSEVSSKKVDEIMSNWTKKMGYPIVKVTSSQQGDKRILTLTQQRFFADGSTDDEHTLWQIPISISTAADAHKASTRILMKEKEMTVTLDNVSADQWVKLNALFTGYYRILYSDSMLKQMLPAVKDKKFLAVDRFNVCGDVFATVRSSLASVTSYLELLECYHDETDYTVWAEIDSSISVMANCFERTEYKPQFDAFCRKLYGKIGAQVGWDPKPGEGHTTGMLRSLVLGRLGRSGDQTVLQEARKRFKSYADGKSDMVPDLRGMVFGLIGKYDGLEGYEALQKIFETNSFPEIQQQALLGFARTLDPALQQRALEYATTDKVRLQDLYMVFAGLCTSSVGQEASWGYFKKNFKQLGEKFGSPGNPLLGYILKYSCEHHCSEEKANDIQCYFKENDLSPALHRPIQQSLEKIRLNISLLKRNQKDVKEWLSKKGY